MVWILPAEKPLKEVSPAEFSQPADAEQIARFNMGRSVRIDIPMNDLASLRYAAGILAGLGQQLGVLASRRDLEPWRLIIEAKLDARSAAGRIRDYMQTEKQKNRLRTISSDSGGK